MKLLLFGKDGQVGWELQRALAPLGELVCCGRADVDLRDAGALRERLRREAADVIVNAAAYTAVDAAEENAEEARRINELAPGVMAEEAARSSGWLVHYSTDYVFDGCHNQPYVETDPVAPKNVYGLTKACGEDAIRSSGCRHLILRSSWVYAARGANFAKTMLRLAAERDELRVVADQIGAPTAAELIADVTALCLYRLQTDPALAGHASGTYHLAAAGETHWHGYAQFVLEAARSHGAMLRAGPAAVTPIASADYPTPAKRPMNSRLDTGKLQRTFNVTLPPWQFHAAQLVAELMQERPS